MILFADEGVERDAPGRAPRAFRIWRAGVNVADDGLVIFTEASAAALLLEQASRGRPYSIDFDHLSLLDDRPATAGRAAGYFALEARPGDGGPELWAVNVEWCADVRAGLEQDPPLWRFISPAFNHTEPPDREVTSLINLALCINPMTHGAPLLASQRTSRHATRSTTSEAGMDEQLALLDKQIEATEDADLKAALTAAREALAAKRNDEEPKESENAAKEGDDKKKDEETKNAASAPTKNATSATGAGAPTTHAQGGSDDAVTTLTKKVVELERRAEVSAINELLAKHTNLPEEFKTHCRAQSLATATVMIGAVTKHSAARASKPTQGGGSEGEALDPRDADEMDRAMGIRPAAAVMPHKLPDGRFVMHNMRPSDLARLNAAQKAKA